MNFWRYRQLHHFFEIHGRSIRDISTLTPFEQLFIEEDPIPHLISEMYRLLGTTENPRTTYIRAWERDLQLDLSTTQLTHLYQLTHSSTMESKTQETNYKILSRWYRVPADLARIYPSVSDQCWRGCGHRGTLLHIWWECPLIKSYWKDIKSSVKEILDLDIPLSPAYFLLHVPSIPIGGYKKSVLPHLLNASRRLVPIYWKQTRVPTKEDWIKKVNDIREAEHWIASCKGKTERFEIIWGPWKDYVFDPNHMSSSLDMALLELAEPSLRSRLDNVNKTH